MSLLQTIQQATTHAREVGALHSLTTDQAIIEDHNLNFVVRILEKIKKKEDLQQQQTKAKVNPFLPYEQDLFVCDLSDNHVCLLNKFNVVDHHILIITRDYQSQEDWLTAADFAALATCMHAMDGLAFYNAGAAAGASQPHKHLQLIPLSQSNHPFSIPIEAAVQKLSWDNTHSQQVPEFAFSHAIAPMPKSFDGHSLFALYEKLLRDLKLIHLPLLPGRQTQPYNLLVTRQWMLLVQRQQDSFQNISVNSLGFAGALLVRSHAQFEFLKRLTPLQLLRQVAYPLNS